VCNVQGSSPSSSETRGKESHSSYRLTHVEAGRGAMAFFLLVVTALWAPICDAATDLADDNPAGFLYALTHLHPIAYLILLLIFVLSVVNLASQGLISSKRWPISLLRDRWRKIGKKVFARRTAGGPARGSGATAAHGGGLSPREAESSVVQVRAQAKKEGVPDEVGIPTPLDGINHPMPHFAPRGQAQVDVTPVTGPVSAEIFTPKVFKVQSAVDVIGAEERERREKKQLVVSGSVTDERGEGIGSVIVYLTDESGQRHGQSCRTRTETGDFKVIADKPGRYLLHTYKRGYTQENERPLALPAEAGRIAGLNVTMIPELCSVEGQVVDEVSGVPMAGVRVNCVCRGDLFSCSGTTDAEGEFLLTGIPINSECQLQVIGPDNRVLGWSLPFETVQKKIIHQDVIIGNADEAAARSRSRTTMLDLDSGPADSKEAPSTLAGFPSSTA
jgi:hypothetical protein